MDLVIDANILFAALIKRNVTSDLLFRNDLHLYAPEFIFEEFEKYRNVIKSKTERSDEEFDELIAILCKTIELVPKQEFKRYIKKAKAISPDIKDVPYVALALKLHVAIWSNDKDLKNKQDEVTVYTTSEIIDL